MPRIKNPLIESKDELTEIILSDILENKIFVPNNILTLKDKAGYLNKLALEFGINLAESELKLKLLTPYSKKSPIRISKKYGVDLSILLFKLAQRFNFDEYLKDVERFKNRYELDSDPTVQNQDTKDILQKLFGNRRSLLSLIHSEWLVIERIGDLPIKGAEWGISVGKLKFAPGNGYVLVETLFNYEGTVRKYSGIASHDVKADYIYIDQVTDDETKRRSNIVIRMADMDYDSQSIMIGHFTYHSKRYMHMQSKTIVMYKVTNDSTRINEFPKIGEYLFNQEGYLSIPREIRQFLYSRDENRMSLPRAIITSLVQLDDFLKSRKEFKLQRIRNTHIDKHYHVFYQRGPKNLVQDELRIDYNEDAMRIECTYLHKPDRHGRNIRCWKGDVYYNVRQNVIIVEMTREKSIHYEEDEDPILLNFILPDETQNLEDVECFQGIISGLEDGVTGPVSFKCLIVKNNNEDFKGKEDEDIIRIFKNEIPSLSINLDSGYMLKEFNF